MLTAKIIDGNAVAQKIRSELAAEPAALAAQGMRPGLATILADDASACGVCVDKKVNAGADVGIESQYHRFETKVRQAKALERINQLDRDREQAAHVPEAPSGLHWSGVWAGR